MFMCNIVLYQYSEVPCYSLSFEIMLGTCDVAKCYSLFHVAVEKIKPDFCAFGRVPCTLISLLC